LARAKKEVVLKGFEPPREGGGGSGDGQSMRGFRKAVRVMSNLVHPNIMPLTGLARNEAGALFVEMPRFRRNLR
jgi:hypothetical protein